MQRFVAVIPGVGNIFGNLLRVDLHQLELPVENHSSLEVEAVGLRVSFGEIAIGEEVLVSTDRCPIFVEACHGQQIWNIDFLDELDLLFDHVLILGNPFYTGQLLSHGHAAGQMPLQMRILGAPDCGDLCREDLLPQVVQIVPHGHQVGLSRKLIGGVAPVGVGKGTQLTGVNKGFQLSLEGFIVPLDPGLSR